MGHIRAVSIRILMTVCLLSPLIAEAIGVPRIRAECPGFDAWVTRLEHWGGR